MCAQKSVTNTNTHTNAINMNTRTQHTHKAEREGVKHTVNVTLSSWRPRKNYPGYNQTKFSQAHCSSFAQSSLPLPCYGL